jgi:hypothetical protein
MAMNPGMDFGSADDRPAGHIFWIPKGEKIGNDKARFHFLVHRCRHTQQEPIDQITATLAHLTTKGTEELVFGAPCHEIKEGKGRLAKPDQEGSFVNGVRLLPRAAKLLRASDKSATRAVPGVRDAVRNALGLIPAAAAVEGSVRGRIVRLVPETRLQYGVILTQPEYSAKRRYQVVAPIINGVIQAPDGPRQIATNRYRFQAARQPWWQTLPGNWTRPLIDTNIVIALSEESSPNTPKGRALLKQIEAVMGHSVDAATLTQIETALITRLEL